MRNQQKLSVAIVGAGIGGLAVAAALRKFFIDPVIYEQADAFARLGAGIAQSPNALKVHRWLGIEERTRDVAFAPANAINRDALSGKVTNDQPLGREIEARYSAPFLTMHRCDLHDALASVVPAETIRLGKTLTQIRERGARVELTFADGTEVEADAVIGADGVHSLIRDHVAGPQQPRFTGRLAYRTTFPSALLRGVEIGPSRTTWWGKDRHIVIDVVTAKRDEVAVTTSQPDKAGAMTTESWSMTGDVAELRDAFAMFHSDLQRVLTAASAVRKSGLYERAPLPTWWRGNVALLGDACHPMATPVGPGVAMALEDAVVLARAIDQADTLDSAFRLYEQARKPRASLVQAGSSADHWMRNQTNPDWLYGYDASRVPLRTSLAADASTYYES